MKIISVFILCAIILGITSSENEISNLSVTNYPTTQDGPPTFPFFEREAPSIPKIIFLKNLLEMNCIKEIMEKNRLKHRSVDQNKENFLLIPSFKNDNLRKLNANRKISIPGTHKKNKFLLIPAKARTNFGTFQNKSRNNSTREQLLGSRKKLKEGIPPPQPIKNAPRRGAVKVSENHKANPKIIPKQEPKKKPNKEEKVEEFSKPTTKKYFKQTTPRPSGYLHRVTKPQPTNSYEVKEVYEEDANVNLNKDKEEAWEKLKKYSEKPQKITSEEVKNNIFEMISKLLSSVSESKTDGKISDGGSAINKKSKLDEKLWPQFIKPENQSVKSSPSRKPVRQENSKGTKENKNVTEEYIKGERFRKKERPNNIQTIQKNSTIQVDNSNLNKKKPFPPRTHPGVSGPGPFKFKNRQHLTNYTTAKPTTKITSTIPGFFQFFKERNTKIEKGNVENKMKKSVPLSIKSKHEAVRKNELGKSNNGTISTLTTLAPSRKPISTQPTTKVPKISSSSGTTATTVTKSVKYYLRTTVQNPEASSQFTQGPTESPVDVTENTTVPQIKKEENSKNSRKMHFKNETKEFKILNETKKSEEDQRRSDILIEEDVDTMNEISAMSYLNRIKNKSTNLSYDTLSAESLVKIVPLVIDDLRKDKILPEDINILSELFGKYWPSIKKLSDDSSLDMLPLLKIKDKKDFEQFFENFNSKEAPEINKANITNSENSSSYDYVEDYKEMYKDFMLQELEGKENTKFRVKRDEEEDLKTLEANTEYFESVEEENLINYMYDAYSDVYEMELENQVEKNKEPHIDQIITFLDTLFKVNGSENIFNFK